MGKQYDKVLKRRRRMAYLERRKQKAKDALVAAAKPKARKPVRKAPAPGTPAEAPAPLPETNLAEAPANDTAAAPAE